MAIGPNDLPVQYKPYFKAINSGVQKMMDIIYDTTTPGLDSAKKLEWISNITRLINSNIKMVEEYVRSGAVDADAEMTALITKPLV